MLHLLGLFDYPALWKLRLFESFSHLLLSVSILFQAFSLRLQRDLRFTKHWRALVRVAVWRVDAY